MIERERIPSSPLPDARPLRPPEQVRADLRRLLKEWLIREYMRESANAAYVAPDQPESHSTVVSPRGRNRSEAEAVCGPQSP